MAAVLLVGSLTTSLSEIEAILTAYGHTVTEQSAANINTTPTLLEGFDSIWIIGIPNGSGAGDSETIAGHIIDLFNGTGHPGAETPGIVVGMPGTSGYARGVSVNNTVAIELGIIGAEQRETRLAAGLPKNVIELSDSWQALVISNGFLTSLRPGDLGGNSTFMDWQEEVDTGDLSHLSQTNTPFAGTKFLKSIVFDGSGGDSCGVAVNTSETLSGKRPGVSAPSKHVWIGGLREDIVAYSAFPAQLMAAVAEWVSESPGYTETFPTVGTQKSFLLGIDLDGIGAFQTSSVDWTEITPAGTTVTVDTTTVEVGVVGAFSGTINGGPINGLSLNDSTTNVQALVRITLDTTNSANTPTVTDLIVRLEGQNDTITIPVGDTTFWDEGSLTWTSGLNKGLVQEIKKYTTATQRLELYLPAVRTIAVNDSFDLLPGCPKTLTICRDRYSNVLNMRAEPFVPGKDEYTFYPDATG